MSKGRVSFGMAEIDYLQIKLLKATNRLAKIPTSAIIKAVEKDQTGTIGIVYNDHMDRWPKVHPY